MTESKPSFTNPRARRWATKADAALYLGCTPRTIDNRIASGKLTRYRNGRLVMIDLDEVDRMLASLPRSAA